MIDCQEKQNIHFIGIGGIGVSALAKYYLSQGCKISGSDLQNSPIIEDLKKQGAGIYLGHKARNLTKSDFVNLVIYSAAVKENNPELEEAKRYGVKCQTYAQALGELTKKYFTIAVSGMHGKSTTTAMIALILVEAGMDPTVIVGTKLREFGGSNFRLGKSKYLIIEADEWHASFLKYWPKMIVLTNIEEEHLDYYKNLNNILKTFEKYISHLSNDGILVANSDDKNISEIIFNFQFSIFNQIQNSKFKIQKYNSKVKIKGLKLKVPGRHNLMNAYAAITVARALSIPDKISVKALNNFKGTWRRFEYKGEVNGAKVFDDYGHHPTEIKATLEAAREIIWRSRTSRGSPTSKLWCVFQPHQYQRTKYLFKDFIRAFDEADKVILLPIYSVAGREKASIIKSVSSEKLAEAINLNQKSKIKNFTPSKVKGQKHKSKIKNIRTKKVIYLNTFGKAINYLKKHLKKDDLAVIMGAGDIYKLTEKLGCG